MKLIKPIRLSSFALILCASLLPLLISAQAIPPASLVNRDILAMRSAGLGDEIIIAKIKTSVCDFDTTPAALVDLKTGGLPENVILAMIERRSPLPLGVSTNTTNSSIQTFAGNATLHFYRERAFVATLRTMPIYIDEAKVADLVNGRQFAMLMEDGKHVLRCRTREEAIYVDFEPGGEYYFRAELIQGFTKNHWRVVQVAKQQGEADIKRLKPLDISDIIPSARMPN